jgi:hypothetical protein
MFRLWPSAQAGVSNMSGNRGVLCLGSKKVELRNIDDPKFAAPDGARSNHASSRAPITGMKSMATKRTILQIGRGPETQADPRATSLLSGIKFDLENPDQTARLFSE